MQPPPATTTAETVGAALAAMSLQAIAAKAAPTGRSSRPLLYCPLTAIRMRQSSSKINNLD
ncbi:MAG: hypothetical protein A3E01_13190 [Gammaproteobacteria bacterium RIFCSPHIGHO2_12_FULL_63_22]|nr:MAG: hypothetical protein A3E01_13190 [Gammaproteobacteria bacterium RIFCSPHIGHO2_12_FULL_63_22]